MKINISWGELTDNSAKKETLVCTSDFFVQSIKKLDYFDPTSMFFALKKENAKKRAELIHLPKPTHWDSLTPITCRMQSRQISTDFTSRLRRNIGTLNICFLCNKLEKNLGLRNQQHVLHWFAPSFGRKIAFSMQTTKEYWTL